MFSSARGYQRVFQVFYFVRARACLEKKITKTVKRMKNTLAVRVVTWRRTRARGTYRRQCHQHHGDDSRVDHVWMEHFGRTAMATTTTTATVERLADYCVWSGSGHVWTKIAAGRWLDSRGLAVKTVRYVRRTRIGHTKSGNDWKLFRKIMTNIVL